MFIEERKHKCITIGSVINTLVTLLTPATYGLHPRLGLVRAMGVGDFASMTRAEGRLRGEAPTGMVGCAGGTNGLQEREVTGQKARGGKEGSRELRAGRSGPGARGGVRGGWHARGGDAGARECGSASGMRGRGGEVPSGIGGRLGMERSCVCERGRRR